MIDVGMHRERMIPSPWLVPGVGDLADILRCHVRPKLGVVAIGRGEEVWQGEEDGADPHEDGAGADPHRDVSPRTKVGDKDDRAHITDLGEE